MHALWLVTFVFGVVSSVIASGKGRNSLGWFLAGMFLGPFALVVAFLPAVEREGMFARCPSCREVIREDAATCRYCHSAQDRSGAIAV
jgi:hypothetical protein